MANYFCTGGQNQDCACPPPKPPCPPPPQPEEDDREDCACRAGFVQALQILLQTQLSSLVDFNRFAFVTGNFVVGSPLTVCFVSPDRCDNLAETLAGSFNRFTPCACELIDISGDVYCTSPAPRSAADAGALLTALITAITENANATASGELTALISALRTLATQTDPTNAAYIEELGQALAEGIAHGSCEALTIGELSLCHTVAIAFEVAGADAAARAANYAAAKTLLTQQLRPGCKRPDRPPCPPYPDPCCDRDGNCGNRGVMDTLGGGNAARSASLTAGNLMIRGASILGSICGVLVLACDEQQRFYFVCSEDVELLD